MGTAGAEVRQPSQRQGLAFLPLRGLAVQEADARPHALAIVQRTQPRGEHPGDLVRVQVADVIDQFRAVLVEPSGDARAALIGQRVTDVADGILDLLPLVLDD